MTQCKTWNPHPSEHWKDDASITPSQKAQYVKLMDKSCFESVILSLYATVAEGWSWKRRKGRNKVVREGFGVLQTKIAEEHGGKKKKIAGGGYLTLQLHALEILLEHKGSPVHDEQPEAPFHPNASRLLYELFHPHCWNTDLENNNSSSRFELLLSLFSSESTFQFPAPLQMQILCTKSTWVKI